MQSEQDLKENELKFYFLSSRGGPPPTQEVPGDILSMSIAF